MHRSFHISLFTLHENNMQDIEKKSFLIPYIHYTLFEHHLFIWLTVNDFKRIQVHL